MKFVYICHPYGNNPENLKKVQRIIADIAMENKMVVPYCPWYAYTQAFNDGIKELRQRGLQLALACLQRGRVQEIWLYGRHISEGMEMEIVKAKTEGIQVVNMSQEITSGMITEVYLKNGFAAPIIKVKSVG